MGGTGDANTYLVSTSCLLLLVPRSETPSRLWVSGVWRNRGAPSFSSKMESTVGDRATADGRILPEGQRQPCRPCVCPRQDLTLARILSHFCLQNHFGPKLRYSRSAVCSQAAYPYDTVMAGRAPPTLGQFAFCLGHVGPCCGSCPLLSPA